ncbi:MAG: adenylyl-sulfate kinase [bacterium]
MTNMPSFAVWVTGIPASGKSTLARIFSQKLAGENIPHQVLESDEIRKILTPKPNYTPEERDSFYFALVELGKMFLKHGITVVFDATAGRRAYREKARQEIPNFMEVYRSCPVEVASDRDPKGLYRKAAAGGIETLPGLQANYEPPENAEIIVPTDAPNLPGEAERIYAKAIELFSK